MANPFVPDSLATLDRLAPVLLDAAIRSGVILALAGLGVLCLRRASAAARHALWLMACVGLILLPVLSAALPGWQVLPRFAAPSTEASVTQIGTVDLPPMDGKTSAPLAAPAALPAAVAPSLPAAPAVSPAALPAMAVVEPPSAPARAATSSEPTKPAAPARPAAAAQPLAGAAPSWPAIIVVVWIVGALLVLAHIALGYLSLFFLQRRCTPVNQGDWPSLLHQLRTRLGIRRPVQLLQSPLRTMPMTWGLWHSRLLLPEQAAAWPAEQRRAVLLHELGHVRRADCLTQLFAQLACALYWFNPLVWIAWRRIQLERERACDDLVLSTGTRASSYAEHLLHSASAGSPRALRFLTAAVAMARPSTLEERLRAILDTTRNRRMLSTRATLAMSLLLLAALVPVAALRAQAVPGTDPLNAGSIQLPSGLALVQETPARPAVPVTPTPYGAPTPPTTAIPNPTAPPMPTRNSQLPIANPPARGGQPFAPNPPTRGGRGGGGAFQGDFNVQPGPVPASVDGPTSSLDATIYDVRIPVDQIGRIDMDALNKAAGLSAAEFEKYLTILGTSQPLYRAKQSVRLAGDNISIGTQTPYVTNSQITANGQTINSVAYRNTGASFSLAGKDGPGGSILLGLNIQVSTLSEGNTPITTTVKAPVFRNSQMQHNGPVTPDRPFVVVSVDGASTDADGKAVAFIARITLGAPTAQINANPTQNR